MFHKTLLMFVLLVFVMVPVTAQEWLVYDGSVLPSQTPSGLSTLDLTKLSQSAPGVNFVEQIIYDYASSGLVLEYLQPDTDPSGTKMYRHDIDDIPDSSFTMVARIKGSMDPIFERAFDVQWRNGVAGTRDELWIYPADSVVRLYRADVQIKVDLNLYEWHTYRITVVGDSSAVYVDEDPQPILTAVSTSSTSDTYIKIGDGSSAAIGGYLDWFLVDKSGDYSPGEGAAIPEFLSEPLEISAYWKFDETSGTTAADETGMNPGTLVNMSGTEWVSGFLGNAIDFAAGNDTSYIEVANHGSIDFDSTRSFSVSYLMKADLAQNGNIFIKGATEFDTTKSWYGIYYQSEIKDREIRFSIDDNGGQREYKFSDTDSTGKTQVGYKLPDAFSSEHWIHFVGVRNMVEDSVIVYVNGERVAAKWDVTTQIGIDLPLVIGSNLTASNRFDGIIDELQFYNYALSDNDVADMFDAYGIASPSMVAYWKMDETSGTTAADEFGTSDGTLVNMQGTEWVPGWVDNAIDFSLAPDTGHIAVPHNSVIEFNEGSFSVSYLMKADLAQNGNIFIKGATEFDTTKSWYGIYYQSEIKDREIRFSIDDNGGQREYKFSDTDSTGKTQVGYSLPTELTSDDWIHFVGVRNMAEDSVIVYVNGERVAAKLDVTTQIGIDLPLVIGSNLTASNRFDGIVDELQFYNFALSDAMVKTLFDAYELVGINDRDRKNIPNYYALQQNYPNPFNPQTTIEFNLAKTGVTTLIVYNILGEKLVTLVNDRLEAGTHKVTFDATGFASGVYLYHLKSGDFSKVRKLIILK